MAAQAERELAGQSLSDEVIQRVAEAAVEAAQPLSENRYKVQLTRVAVKRALLEASGRA